MDYQCVESLINANSRFGRSLHVGNGVGASQIGDASLLHGSLSQIALVAHKDHWHLVAVLHLELDEVNLEKFRQIFRD